MIKFFGKVYQIFQAISQNFGDDDDVIAFKFRNFIQDKVKAERKASVISKAKGQLRRSGINDIEANMISTSLDEPDFKHKNKDFDELAYIKSLYSKLGARPKLSSSSSSSKSSTLSSTISEMSSCSLNTSSTCSSSHSSRSSKRKKDLSHNAIMELKVRKNDVENVIEETENEGRPLQKTVVIVHKESPII